jgi:hypothetical protein
MLGDICSESMGDFAKFWFFLFPPLDVEHSASATPRAMRSPMISFDSNLTASIECRLRKSLLRDLMAG